MWGGLTVVAVLWVVGLYLGRFAEAPAVWLGVAGVVLVPAAWMAVCGRAWPAKCWGAVAVVAVGAAWLPLRSQVPADDVSHFAGEGGQLADVVGTVKGPVAHVMPPREGMDRFLVRPPSTRFVLAVRQIKVDGEVRPASGRTMVRLGKHDHRVRSGDRIEVTGWLRRIGGPSNPGQFDYRRYMADQGVHSSLRVPERGNWRRVPGGGGGVSFGGVKEDAARLADDSLHLGMGGRDEAYAFLSAILLGRRGPEFSQLHDSFQRVGLAHFLAISGAHLGVLLGLTWLGTKVVLPHPRYGAWAIVAVLALFILVVPLRVPIVRAGVMSFVFSVAYGGGRLVRRLDLLSVAALLLLIWRPAELFGAGFQLSFAVTAGILIFTEPASRWLWPEPEIRLTPYGTRALIARRLADYVAVTLVATSMALPIVAMHFGLLTPLSAVVSIVAIPFGVGVLGLGYLKTVVGLVLPSAGTLLAAPTAWLGEFVIGSVRWTAELPAASIDLVTRPPAAWVVCVLLLSCAFWGGWFRGRWAALGGAVALCTVWFVVTTRPDARIGLSADPGAPVVARVDALAVGDGSAYLLRVAGEDGGALGAGRPHAVLFDCGSLTYLDVGDRVIVPGLKALGVGRIDAIVISHANLDHYNGCLPVVEQLGARRVVTTRQVVDEAARYPSSPIGEFLGLLRGFGVEPVAVGQGWRERWGGATAEVLWPPEGVEFPEVNDASIVLRLSAGGRRVLLHGDVQEFAIGRLLSAGVDLRAEVSDLPHHGGFVRSSPSWLTAVSPRLVVQSASPRRLLHDKWGGVLDERGVARAVTGESGQVAVELYADGAIVWEGFHGGGAVLPAELDGTGARPVGARVNQ